MFKKINISTFLLVFALEFSFAQLNYSPKELFDEGIYFFNRKEYKEAVYFFKQLLVDNTSNAHYNFLVGECYLNIENQEHLAVPYLEKAIKNTTSKKKYNGSKYTEVRAPWHAYFYLGQAYRFAGEVDKALAMYNTFYEAPDFYLNYNEGVVLQEIKACERSITIKNNAFPFEREKFPDSINTSNKEYMPVVSEDGNHMIFIRTLKFYDAIFYTAKNTSGEWATPINITPQVGSDGDMLPTALNNNGTKLLLAKQFKNNYDIYISQLKDTAWSKASKLKGKVNSQANEVHACFGNNDNHLFLVSNNSLFKGSYDIFEVYKKNGVWDKPVKLESLCSEFDEHSLSYNKENKRLVFSSKGHLSMGGYDIFYSDFKDEKWSNPVNIGYPLNTTRDDIFFQILTNDISGVYATPENIGYEEPDIWFIRITHE